VSLRPDMTLEVLNARGRCCLPDLFGFRVMALEQGLLVAEIDIRPELLAPNGFLHAATVIALADTACGYGCIAHMPKGSENFTTVELKSNFLGTAREGTIACVAKPAHLGRNTQVWDATVTRHADGKPIALFRCTQMILWPKADR
jgi:1,4-dihydroxy-2-naphthoyl-CoA hydrolase